MFGYAQKHRGIAIPSTVDEWQLYDKPTSPAAAKALTQAAREAIDMIADAKISDAKAIQRTALKHLHTVCEKFAANGAYDSEPIGEAGSVIEAAWTEFVGGATW